MTRPRHVSQDSVKEALSNLERTSVILAGVSDYDDLPKLSGPSSDMEMMASLLLEDDRVSLFGSSQVTELENPTSSEFRQAIVGYAQSRSARGDVLMIYFTGHGCALGPNSFGFCLTDTKVGLEGRGVLPLTAVSLDDIVATLAACDVHPVFVIDACFSSTTAPQGYALLTSGMQAALSSATAESYALLASSSQYSPSVDTPEGGAFTQALFSIALGGFSDQVGRRMPFITLDQLAAPVQAELARLGYPLSRCYIGRDLPLIPVARNSRFRQQSERFVPFMKKIVEMAWNGGSPKDIEVSQFTDIGQGAYANHSKLSLAPWALLEDVGSNNVRRLTARGIAFVRGEVCIPKVIIRDPLTGDWVPSAGSDDVGFEDVP